VSFIDHLWLLLLPCLAFLVMYVAHHMTADSTKFGGDGLSNMCIIILVTHIVLSIIIIPLVLITMRALKSLISIKK
jgi:putative membrane protein